MTSCPQALLGQAAHCGPWIPGKLVLTLRQTCPLTKQVTARGQDLLAASSCARHSTPVPLLHMLVSSLCYTGAKGTHAKGGHCVLGCQH